MAVLAMHTAATGLEALSTEIDVTANNLANVNTTGFKRSRVNFEDLLYQLRRPPGTPGAGGAPQPAGLQVGLGTRVSNTQILFSQGSPIETGRALDMTINGEGFFRVRIYDDVGGGFGYTRAGNFSTNRDGELVLGNSDGFRLDPPIQIPENAIRDSITVSSDGVVSVLLPGEDEITEVGQITLSRFANAEGLMQIGKNVYVPTAASGEAFEAEPGSEGVGTILNNFLESSNVDPVKELINLIKSQRAFELNSKVITTSNEMLQVVTHLKQ